MSNVTLLSKVLLRNATKSDWELHKTKVLLKGEAGLSFNESTGLVEEFKIGNGTSTWEQLPSQTTILQGTAAPTSSTKGSLGQLYVVNLGTVELYQCTAISGTTYTWTKNEGKSYGLSAEASDGGANIKLTDSDSTVQNVNIRGDGATTVSKDSTGILVSSTDNDTKVSNVVNNTGKVLTGLEGNTTLKQTDVEDLKMVGYTKAAAAGAISANDSLETAFSKLENELANLDLVDALSVDEGKVVVGFDASAPEQWTRINAVNLLLSGYTKSTDAGTITNTDTMAKALSKLENALADLADGMVYSGALAGGDTGEYGALTPAAEKGNTYKINVNGRINGIKVHTGDLIICNMDGTVAATSANYTSVVGNWDFFSFDSSMNATSSTTLSASQLVVGDSGGRDIKTLPQGSDGQVLKTVGTTPTWSNDKDTHIDTVNVSNGISATLSVDKTQLDLGITTISTDLFTQGTNTLIINGGDSNTP